MGSDSGSEAESRTRQHYERNNAMKAPILIAAALLIVGVIALGCDDQQVRPTDNKPTVQCPACGKTTDAATCCGKPLTDPSQPTVRCGWRTCGAPGATACCKACKKSCPKATGCPACKQKTQQP